MGLQNSGIAVIEIEPRKTGEREIFHNGDHLQARMLVVDHFTCRHIERVRANALPDVLSKRLQTPDLGDEDEVHVYVDRSLVGEPSVRALRKKLGRSFYAYQVRTDWEEPRGVQVISGQGQTFNIGSQQVAGLLDVISSLVVALDEGRMQIANISARGLEGELTGFDGQPDRVRARALAMATWAAVRTPTVYVETDLPKMSAEERRMMELASRKSDDEEDNIAIGFDDDDPWLDEEQPDLGRGNDDLGGFGRWWNVGIMAPSGRGKK